MVIDLLRLFLPFLIGYLGPLSVRSYYKDPRTSPRYADDEEDWGNGRGCTVYIVASLVIGLMMGVVAPAYLKTEGWTSVYLVLWGGSLLSLFIAGALGWLMGDAGCSLGILGFAGVLQYVIWRYEEVIQGIMTLFRVGILVGLSMAAIALVVSLVTGEALPKEPSYRVKGWSFTKVLKAILAIISAAGTVLEFVRLFFPRQ